MKDGYAPRLLGAGGAAVDPDFHLGGGVGTGEGRKRAAWAWIPAPSDEVVMGDVIPELLKIAATILLGIF